MAHDVFISHSTKDVIIANAVCATLEERKIQCWIAPRDVPVGAKFTKAIVEAIEGCQIMILIFSSASMNSNAVENEIHLAFDQEMTIIPFRVEDVVPKSGLKFLLQAVQYLNAIKPPMEPHLETLAGKVQQLLTQRASETSSTSDTSIRNVEAELKGLEAIISSPSPPIKTTVIAPIPKAQSSAEPLPANTGNLRVECVKDTKPNSKWWLLEIYDGDTRIGYHEKSGTKDQALKKRVEIPCAVAELRDAYKKNGNKHIFVRWNGKTRTKQIKSEDTNSAVILGTIPERYWWTNSKRCEKCKIRGPYCRP